MVFQWFFQGCLWFFSVSFVFLEIEREIDRLWDNHLLQPPVVAICDLEGIAVLGPATKVGVKKNIGKAGLGFVSSQQAMLWKPSGNAHRRCVSSKLVDGVGFGRPWYLYIFCII